MGNIKIEKKQIFKIIYNNIDKIIQIIGVILLALSNFIKSINFELYYGIPMEYGGDSYYFNWKQVLIVLVITFLYGYMRYVKSKLDFKSKIDRITYIFLSILYGLILGVYIFLVFSMILSFYASTYIQKMFNRLPEWSYWIILIIIIVVCILHFLLSIVENNKNQKIANTILSIMVIFLLIFIVKFSIGFSNKRSYEIIDYENSQRVVLSKIDNNKKLIIADAIIDEEENIMIINTKIYGNINNENLFFQYRTFRNVEIEK